MPEHTEHDGENFIIIGRRHPLNPLGQVLIANGSRTDMEDNREIARNMVRGSPPPCDRAWVVKTIFDASSADAEPDRA